MSVFRLHLKNKNAPVDGIQLPIVVAYFVSRSEGIALLLFSSAFKSRQTNASGHTFVSCSSVDFSLFLLFCNEFVRFVQSGSTEKKRCPCC